jgi:alkylhydroperoxidase/carboxymuconolactone decarboxylase family protein YurZ
MSAASVERANLSPEALMLVRLAALVAVDAPPASFLVNLGAGAETDLTLEDARSVLVAVAPIVGGPRVVSAAGNIARALGFAALSLEVDEAEADKG